MAPFRAEKKIRHEVEFYAHDAGFVNGFARFIEGVLTAGNAVIVVATESHHAKLREIHSFECHRNPIKLHGQ